MGKAAESVALPRSIAFRDSDGRLQLRVVDGDTIPADPKTAGLDGMCPAQFRREKRLREGAAVSQQKAARGRERVVLHPPSDDAAS